MKRLALALALVAVLGQAALPASAADAMTGSHMNLACTPTQDTAKANASVVMDGNTVALVCHASAAMMAHEMKTIGKVAAKTRTYGPNIDGLLTPAQIDTAWKTWTDATFHMTSTP